MKDWTHKAAEEIVAKGRWTTAEDVASVIAKHHARVVKLEPGHLADWAARAGAYLHAEGVRLSSHRIAAVVAHFAEPLVKLLKEARREHHKSYLAEENDHDPCPKSYEDSSLDAKCTCSADAWNARIDEVLK